MRYSEGRNSGIRGDTYVGRRQVVVELMSVKCYFVPYYSRGKKQADSDDEDMDQAKSKKKSGSKVQIFIFTFIAV